MVVPSTCFVVFVHGTLWLLLPLMLLPPMWVHSCKEACSLWLWHAPSPVTELMSGTHARGVDKHAIGRTERDGPPTVPTHTRYIQANVA